MLNSTDFNIQFGRRLDYSLAMASGSNLYGFVQKNNTERVRSQLLKII